MIDKSSPEFMFGQIMARLNEGDKAMDDLAGQMGEVRRIVSGLPCKEMGSRVKDVEGWQHKHNAAEERSTEVKMKFRHALLIAVISTVAGSLVSFVMALAIVGG